MRRLVTVVLLLLFCLVFGSLVPASACALNVDSPNGREIWIVGSKHNITWFPSAVAQWVTLEYSTDSGVTWNLIYGGNSDSGLHEWTVPDTPTTNARVRVTQFFADEYWGKLYITEYADMSDADFSILGKLDWIIIPIMMPPAAPAEFTATAASSSTIRLSWQDKSTNEEGFKVFRKTVSGAYSLIKTLGADTITYLDRGLEPNTQYIYKVQAYNGAGAKDSNEDSASTRPPDPAPARIVMRFYIDNTDYYINDVLVGMDVAPVIRDGRTLVPIRYVADPLGADISWDGAAGKATASLRGKVVELWVGKNIAQVNGVAKLIDPLNPNVTAITLPPGRIVLPLRFVAENLGCEVNWNATTQEVMITYTPPSGGGGGSIL